MQIGLSIAKITCFVRITETHNSSDVLADINRVSAGFDIDRDGFVSYKNSLLFLPPKERGAFRLLLNAWPKVVSKEDFSKNVWARPSALCVLPPNLIHSRRISRSDWCVLVLAQIWIQLKCWLKPEAHIHLIRIALLSILLCSTRWAGWIRNRKLSMPCAIS